MANELDDEETNSHLPCGTCPWRIERDASTIPRYNHQKAVGLLATVGEGDDFRKIMACHNSTDDNMIACKGYLAREGWSNLYVRMLLAKGDIPHPDAVLYSCETYGIELEQDYPTVLMKLATSRERIQPRKREGKKRGQSVHA